MDIDFSELEKLHKETFEKVIDIVVNHYDTWVKDDQLKIKALTQIKKETEQLTKLFGEKKNDDED